MGKASTKNKNVKKALRGYGREAAEKKAEISNLSSPCKLEYEQGKLTSWIKSVNYDLEKNAQAVQLLTKKRIMEDQLKEINIKIKTLREQEDLA